MNQGELHLFCGLQDVKGPEKTWMDRICGSMGHHGTSWDIMGHHGTSWDIMGHHGTSWDIMGHHGTMEQKDV